MVPAHLWGSLLFRLIHHCWTAHKSMRGALGGCCHPRIQRQNNLRASAWPSLTARPKAICSTSLTWDHPGDRAPQSSLPQTGHSKHEAERAQKARWGGRILPALLLGSHMLVSYLKNKVESIKQCFSTRKEKILALEKLRVRGQTLLKELFSAHS